MARVAMPHQIETLKKLNYAGSVPNAVTRWVQDLQD